MYRFLVLNLRKMYSILLILVKIEHLTRIRISNRIIEDWYNTRGKHSSLVRKTIRFNCQKCLYLKRKIVLYITIFSK